MELHEGKDCPTQLHNKEFDEMGKTIGTLLRLTKLVWGSGNIFVLDSGFCVLRAIIELKKKGVFAAALIKKRPYWPKYIPGDAIITHFWGQGNWCFRCLARRIGECEVPCCWYERT